MDERDWLTEQFEEHRSHLRAVAYRMLGFVSEADYAGQESWLRLVFHTLSSRAARCCACADRPRAPRSGRPGVS